MTPSPATLREDGAREALRDVIDPELGYNIVDLGLVYGIAIEGGVIDVTMTMTTPGCSHAGEGAGWPEPMQSLDNRGLQPPEPMVRILSALEDLAPGAVLEAWNDREPLLLYPELEARGAVIEVSRKAEGVRLLIRRGVTP